MVRKKYEQICHLFAPSVVQTAVFMLPLNAGCCLFKGKDQLPLALLAYPVLSHLPQSSRFQAPLFLQTHGIQGHLGGSVS